MIFSLIACAAAFQKGSPTTPIPPVKTVHAGSHGTAHVPKKPKPTQVEEPPFVDNPTGTGEPAKDGAIVEIQFAVTKATGERLADSQKRGLPYTFKLGEPGNDPLLDRVVRGMRVGGVRTGTVSAADAYGPEGMPPLIKPDDSLVVTITLLRLEEK